MASDQLHVCNLCHISEPSLSSRGGGDSNGRLEMELAQQRQQQQRQQQQRQHSGSTQTKEAADTASSWRRQLT